MSTLPILTAHLIRPAAGGYHVVLRPSIMAGFVENGGLHDYLVEGVRRTLFEPDAPYLWPENRDGWTVEHLDWSDPANQQRRRTLRPSTGWRWHGRAAREGVTVVG